MAHNKKTKMRTVFKQYIQGKGGLCFGRELYIRKKKMSALPDSGNTINKNKKRKLLVLHGKLMTDLIYTCGLALMYFRICTFRERELKERLEKYAF